MNKLPFALEPTSAFAYLKNQRLKWADYKYWYMRKQPFRNPIWLFFFEDRI